MNVTEPVLTDSKTLNEVVNCLTEHIPIQTQGQCDGVLHEKIWAAFVRFICVPRRVPVVIRLVLKNVPTSNDIRYHLEKYTDINSLESDLNAALQSRLPDGIRQGKHSYCYRF